MPGDEPQRSGNGGYVARWELEGLRSEANRGVDGVRQQINRQAEAIARSDEQMRQVRTDIADMRREIAALPGLMVNQTQQAIEAAGLRRTSAGVREAFKFASAVLVIVVATVIIVLVTKSPPAH